MTRTAAAAHFVRHLTEMVLAMAAGMAISSVLFRVMLGPEGYEALRSGRPMLWYAGMAPFMTGPMVALMRHHGARWRRCAEMSAAMLVPPAGVIALVQAGVTSSLPWLSMQTLSASVHVAMIASMLGLMLYRRAEYSGGRHDGITPPERARAR